MQIHHIKLVYLLLAILALAGCRRGGAPEEKKEAAEPAAVEMVTVATHPMETVVVAQGTVSPAQGSSARVAAAVAGRIIDVRGREGGSVRAGQVIATVDNRPQQAQARSAAAALTASESQARSAALAAQAAASDQQNAVQQARLNLESAT